MCCRFLWPNRVVWRAAWQYGRRGVWGVRGGLGALPCIVICQMRWVDDFRMWRVKKTRNAMMTNIAKFGRFRASDSKNAIQNQFTRDKRLEAWETCYLGLYVLRVFLYILRNIFFESLRRASRDEKGWMTTALRGNKTTWKNSELAESLPHLLVTIMKVLGGQKPSLWLTNVIFCEILQDFARFSKKSKILQDLARTSNLKLRSVQDLARSQITGQIEKCWLLWRSLHEHLPPSAFHARSWPAPPRPTAIGGAGMLQISQATGCARVADLQPDSCMLVGSVVDSSLWSTFHWLSMSLLRVPNEIWLGRPDSAGRMISVAKLPTFLPFCNALEKHISRYQYGSWLEA